MFFKTSLYRSIIKIALAIALPFILVTASQAFIVVLDAGHGGKDPGALGTYSKEKNINLNVVLRLGKMIQENCRDVTIIYTRKTDKFVELYERANIANNAKADLFISVHTNSTTNSSTYGTETYSLTLEKASTNLEVVRRENSVIQYENNKQRYATNSLENKIMSEVIMGSNMRTSALFAKSIQDEYRRVGRVNRGVHQQNFHVLRQVAMPSVLTELGFISTPSEEAYLNSEQGINELATCIFNAFRKHISPILRGASEGLPEPVTAEPSAPQIQVGDNEGNKIQESTSDEQNSHQNKESVTQSQVASQQAKLPISNQTSSNTKTEQKTTNTYVFKVQICTTNRQLRKDSEQFKGLKDVETYPVTLPNGRRQYIHTYGSSTSYREISSIKEKIRQKFSDCFIVVFKDGQKITGEEASQALRKQR